MIKYSIVQTSWGEVMLAGSSRGLCGLALPPSRKCDPHRRAQKIWPDSIHAGSLLQDLQAQVAAYFEGDPIDFNTSVDLFDVSDFQRKILSTANLPLVVLIVRECVHSVPQLRLVEIRPLLEVLHLPNDR